MKCISHTIVENLKQLAFKGDKSRVVHRTFWLIKVVPTWKKFEKRCSDTINYASLTLSWLHPHPNHQKTHTHTHMYINICRVIERESLRETGPRVRQTSLRLNYINIPKNIYIWSWICYRDIHGRKRWSSCGSMYCTCSAWCITHTLCESILELIDQPSQAKPTSTV
jgi:hypothetical protein